MMMAGGFCCQCGVNIKLQTIVNKPAGSSMRGLYISQLVGEEASRQISKYSSRVMGWVMMLSQHDDARRDRCLA
jgi:hypothetical protein